MITVSGSLKQKTLHLVSWILLFLTLANYQEVFSQMEVTKYGSSVNGGYTLICIFLLYCISGFNKRTNILFFIIFGLVILSAKRGAIISMLFVSLAYIVCRYGQKVRLLAFALPIVLGLMFGVAGYIYENNDNLQTKIEATKDGNSSGREQMNEYLWWHFMNSSMSEKVYGYQFGASIGFFGFDAHNDWLEILTSQGIIGVVLYVFVLASLWAIYIRRKKFLLDYEKFVVVGVLLMWMAKSYISQTVYGGDGYYFAICYGFAIAQSYRREKLSLS